MSGVIYVLPVRQPEANSLAIGKTRQLSRAFPCERRFAGHWFAIQATELAIHQKGYPRTPRAESCKPFWAVVALGRLGGVGYHPGFCRDPEFHVARAYKRETGQPGPWVWTFTNVTRIAPVELPRIPEARGAFDGPPYGGDRLEWTDDGSGDLWGCCPRVPDEATLKAIRAAYKAAKTKGLKHDRRDDRPAARRNPDDGPLFR